MLSSNVKSDLGDFEVCGKGREGREGREGSEGRELESLLSKFVIFVFLIFDNGLFVNTSLSLRITKIITLYFIINLIFIYISII